MEDDYDYDLGKKFKNIVDVDIDLDIGFPSKSDNLSIDEFNFTMNDYEINPKSKHRKMKGDY